MNKKLIVSAVVAIALIFTISISGIYASGHLDKGWSRCSSSKCGSDKGDLESKFYKKAHMIMENGEKLSLSDKIVAEIKELKMSTKKGLIMKKAEIEVVALDIKSMLYEEKINTEEINKLIDKKYDLKKEKTKTIVAAYARLKGYLSKDQMEKLGELYKECKSNKKN
ncbi:MAG: hypothetical protein ABH875_00060 [Candidatus Omnitrophota bacterium]